MDYSERVNSKQGGGGVADTAETNVQTKKRIRELLTISLDLDNDPYVRKSHNGMLECKLCFTTHVNEASYISHLGGKKHHINLAHRKMLDDKQNQSHNKHGISINSVPKRKWQLIGKPAFRATKIRDPETEKLGLSVVVKYPQAAVTPDFRIMSFAELSTKQDSVKSKYGENHQFLVILAEPYENICLVIPDRDIDKPNDDRQLETYWSYFDDTTKDYYVQFFFK